MNNSHGREFLSRLSELHPRRFFLETWRAIDEEAARERARSPGYDARPLISFVVGAICLTLMQYFGSSYDLTALVDRMESDPSGPLAPLAGWLGDSRFYSLFQHGYWALWRVFGYFVVPALTVKLVFRERLRDHGLNTRGFFEHLWIYLVCFGAVLILVVAASFRGEFVDYYPFYRRAGRSWFDLLAWEAFYAAQFFALEFFFRGFWLSACKTAMGSYGIVAMLVPYCMIHFGKPWMETLAAIAAGIVLGTLALKTRSIWSGFLIHVSVALSMDLAAIIQNDAVPRSWWPG
jgi:membrane protease YdiL (CAAX protease family)